MRKDERERETIRPSLLGMSMEGFQLGQSPVWRRMPLRIDPVWVMRNSAFPGGFGSSMRALLIT